MFLMEVQRVAVGGVWTFNGEWLPYRIIGTTDCRVALNNAAVSRVPKDHDWRVKRVAPIRSNDLSQTIRRIWGA